MSRRTKVATGYASVAAELHRGGWAALPVPKGKKLPVPDEFTGYDGKWPSGADIASWSETHAAWNVAVRLPRNVVGIDVDAYKSSGRDSWQHAVAAAAELGQELPATVRISSRYGDAYDGDSGIRLFRLPKEWEAIATERIWRTELCGGVEILRYGHRYCMTAPSTHPDGGEYQIMDESSGELLDSLPAVDSLPLLPEAWRSALLKDNNSPLHGEGSSPASSTTTSSTTTSGSRYWTDGKECSHTLRALGSCTSALAGRSRHDAALRGLTTLTRLGEQGHPGVRRAAELFHGQWLAAVTAPGEGQRDAAEAAAEWERMLEGLDAEIRRAGLTEPHDRGCQEIPAWNYEPPEGDSGTPAGEPDDAPKYPRLGMTLKASELDSLPPIRSAIDGVLHAPSSTLLVGKYSVGKSAVLLSWALCIATGTPWLGREVEQRRALVVVGEGARGLHRRVAAWSTAWRRPVPDDSISFMVRPNSLKKPETWAELADFCTAEGYGALFLDTLSSLTPDGDEVADAPLLTAGLNYISERIDGSAVMTHHPGWGDTTRARGGSQLHANVDAVLLLQATDKSSPHLELVADKLKDGESGGRMYLRRIVVDLPDGQQSVTVETGSARDAAGSMKPRVLAAVQDSPDEGVSRSLLAAVLGIPSADGGLGRALRALQDEQRIRKEGAGPRTRYYPVPE